MMDPEVINLMTEVSLLQSRVTQLEQAIGSIKEGQRPVQAPVSSQDGTLSVAQFRQMISALAKDFAEFPLDSGTADMTAGGKIVQKRPDGVEMVPLSPIHRNHADVKDGGQRIDSRLKVRDLFAKLLNFRIFRVRHRVVPSAGRGDDGCRVGGITRQRLSN